uniref:NADH dehydrogenase [ubiquinone] 1 beta subcomplex subunit 3 n=1 Tax=Poecilia latipinna TaxID=48699 RepID=A0A3B3UW78_9TELE
MFVKISSACFHHLSYLHMGGDHGHSKMSMPDWRQWKVEGTPLEFTQQRLAARGLKDPWARNEAWRYSGGFARAVTLSEVLFRGFKWGFAAFTVALAIEYTMFPPKKGGH